MKVRPAPFSLEGCRPAPPPESWDLSFRGSRRRRARNRAGRGMVDSFQHRREGIGFGLQTPGYVIGFGPKARCRKPAENAMHDGKGWIGPTAFRRLTSHLESSSPTAQPGARGLQIHQDGLVGGPVGL